MASEVTPVLLYDGECGLCNATIRFMLKHDRRGALMFAPLQGSTAQRFLRARGLPVADFDSIVFVEDLRVQTASYHLRTAGALRALEEMGGGWRRAARVLRCIPASWRDAGYRIVARLRYRLYGRYQPAPLPNPAWARRILE